MRGLAELLIGLMKKNITNCMRCNRKIGEGILAGQNRKGKRKIKTGKDFWLLET
jgi:hypothetical protein